MRKQRVNRCFISMHNVQNPSGTPASLASSASRRLAPGTFSEGLRTNVLPHAIAVDSIQRGTIAGKLKG